MEIWLDGHPWRSLHEDVVVGAGLHVGAVLDRRRAASVARERRRAAAMVMATRAVRSRDHSAASLRRRLEGRGASAAVSADTVERLESAGIVDDRRASAARARRLAERGWGDTAIRANLDARGFLGEAVDEAIEALEAEAARAAAIVDRAGRSGATVRLLARRGFSDDVVEDVVASLPDGAIA